MLYLPSDHKIHHMELERTYVNGMNIILSYLGNLDVCI